MQNAARRRHGPCRRDKLMLCGCALPHRIPGGCTRSNNSLQLATIYTCCILDSMSWAHFMPAVLKSPVNSVLSTGQRVCARMCVSFFIRLGSCLRVPGSMSQAWGMARHTKHWTRFHAVTLTVCILRLMRAVPPMPLWASALLACGAALIFTRAPHFVGQAFRHIQDV